MLENSVGLLPSSSSLWDGLAGVMELCGWPGKGSVHQLDGFDWSGFPTSFGVPGELASPAWWVGALGPRPVAVPLLGGLSPLAGRRSPTSPPVTSHPYSLRWRRI